MLEAKWVGVCDGRGDGGLVGSGVGGQVGWDQWVVELGSLDLGLVKEWMWGLVLVMGLVCWWKWSWDRSGDGGRWWCWLG